MAVQPDEPLQWVPMSWEQFLALPEKPRAEWVDGVAIIMNAPVLPPHGGVVTRLAALLVPLLPDYEVVTGIGLRLGSRRLRAPDLMVCLDPPPDSRVTTPPLLCVEVLSRSTRSEDTVRKSMEYAEGGVGQYWLVDPELRTLEAMGLVDGAWEVLAHLDDEQPAAEVELAGVTVPVDLDRLVRR